MFRTVRAVLLVAPAAFAVTLAAFLLTHPRAPGSFVAYPFMADALGQGVLKYPVLRFSLTSAAFFIPPYLILGLLLFLAETGLAAAAPLWRGRSRGRGADEIPPESRWAFGGISLVLAAWAGVSLHRVASGGELPGGVNVAPLFVVAASFGAVAAGLVAALLIGLPRALLGTGRAARTRRTA